MDFLSDLLQSGFIDARCRRITRNSKEEEYEETFAYLLSIMQNQKSTPEKMNALRKCQDIYLKEHLNRFYNVGFADGTELIGSKSETKKQVEKEKENVYADSASFPIIAERNELENMKDKMSMDYQILSEMLAYLAGFIDAVSTILK